MKRVTLITLICMCVAIAAVPVILSFTLPGIVWAQWVQYIRWSLPGLVFIVAQGLVIPAVVLVTIWGVRRSDRKANRDIIPESRDRVLRANRNADYWQGQYETTLRQRNELRGNRRVARRHAQIVLQDLEGE